MDLVPLLQALVRIDSTSSRPNGHVLDLLEGELKGRGFTFQRSAWIDDHGVPKENLVCRRGPDRPGGLMLLGHTDCVPFAAEWAEALSGVERDGCIHGRGSADTKGFLAAAVTAACRTRAGKQPLTLLFTADEEVGCVGSRKLAEAKPLSPRYAIVGEPTSLTPVRAHKGYCLARVEVIGREAHSAHPERGASAIFAAGLLLARIDDLGRALSQERHEGFDPPFTTVNVGVLRGGEAPNVVAGSCRFTLEWRPLPGEAPSRVLDAVRGLAHEVGLARGVGVSVKPLRLDRGLETSPAGDLVRFLEQAGGRAPATVAYYTDAPHLAELGAQVAVFGPGDIRVAHATGEFVPCEELKSCADVLARAITHFCG